MALIGYAVFISAVFVAMPENPDEVTAPMDLVNGFRIMSVLGRFYILDCSGFDSWYFMESF